MFSSSFVEHIKNENEYLANPITLPIEVIGFNGNTQTITIDVTNSQGIDFLYLKIHRPSYRDAIVNPSRGAKASIKINQGSSIDLKNSNNKIEVYEPEKSYGGLGGGYNTVRLKIATTAIVDGSNTIEFKFNGTDGLTTGYRVLELNVLKNGKKIISANNFITINPKDWNPPISNPNAVVIGKELWNNKMLKESPISTTNLNAKCTSCHAQDGRDLKYFNYSNRSIVQRSMFHGLTKKEGKQIASYIRSLNTPAPRSGRPWNPPYQPGPGLDSKPIEDWSAGAGLDKVLENDKDMLPYIFPDGTALPKVEQVINTHRTTNMRETPIALQLPDWNDWLPHVHPLDLWGSDFVTEDIYTTYKNTRGEFENGLGNSNKYGEILSVLNNFRKKTNAFIGFMNGPQPCKVYYGNTPNPRPSPQKRANIDKIHPTYDCEDALVSLNQWSAIKHWELMQEFALEELTDNIYPSGEKRGWPGRWRQVFEIPAHRSANNSRYFKHQNILLGDYSSTSWYHLQVILNAGNRDPKNHFPADWKYNNIHMFLNSKNSEQWHSLRHIQSNIKLLQNLDMNGLNPNATDRGPEPDGWWMRHVVPTWFYAADSRIIENGAAKMSQNLDTYQVGLKVKVYNAFLKTWLDKTESYPIAQWERGNGPGKLDPASYRPTAGETINSKHYADLFYRIIPIFNEEGVHKELLIRLANWCKKMWPLGDWDALKNHLNILSGIYYLKNKETNKWLTKVSGNNLKTKKAVGGNSEWEIIYQASNGYKVKNVSTNTYLGINTTDNSVYISNKQGGFDKRWEFLKTDKNAYRLKNIKSTELLRGNSNELLSQSTVRNLKTKWELVFVRNKESISGNNILPEIEVYPNPVTDDSFTISFSNQIINMPSTSVRIMDISGKVIHANQSNNQENTIKINTKNLHSGMYIVYIKNDTHSWIKKIIIN